RREGAAVRHRARDRAHPEQARHLQHRADDPDAGGRDLPRVDRAAGAGRAAGVVSARRDHVRPGGPALLPGRGRRVPELHEARDRLPQALPRDEPRRVPRAVRGRPEQRGPLERGVLDASLPAQAHPRAQGLRRERALSRRDRPGRGGPGHGRGRSSHERDHPNHEGRGQRYELRQHEGPGRRSVGRGEGSVEMKSGPLADYQSLKSDVLSCLREVAELAEDTGSRSLAERLRSDRIPRLEQERFHLVVLGEFNHGKTTFVNALLGAPVLPTGVTPTTAVIHHVVHGERAAAKAVADGHEHGLPVEQVADYVVGGRAVADAVKYLEIDYPAAILDGGVVLVDTPGVNDINSTRAEITYSYLPRADAILFLLDAGQILKESERAFIANKLLSHSRDKVLFIINKIDLLDDDEREEAIAYARTHLARLVEEPKVFAVSAQRALEGDLDGSGLARLTEELKGYLTDERGRVLLDNALDAGLRATVTLKQSVQIQKRALEMDQADLERRLAALEGDLSSSEAMADKRERQIRESLSGVKALIRRECEDFGKRFALALPAEIESSKADDLKRYLPSFMEERFRTFADSQGEELAKRLEKVAEEAIAFVSEDAKERSKKLREVLGNGAPAVDLNVSTLAYDVGV